MTVERNKLAVRMLYETVLNERDFDRLAELISEDYVGARGERGASGFADTVKGLVGGFPDIRWTVENLVGEGDQVAVEWSWTGNHSGAFRSFPASGKNVHDHAAVVYRFGSDGKIVQASLHSDRLGFLQQIGVTTIPTFAPVPTGGR